MKRHNRGFRKRNSEEIYKDILLSLSPAFHLMTGVVYGLDKDRSACFIDVKSASDFQPRGILFAINLQDAEINPDITEAIATLRKHFEKPD